MKNKVEKIDQYFKEHFEQFEQQPPETVWKTVASRLGHQRKKGMIVLIFRVAAGMALLLSLGIAYYFLNRSERPVHAPGLSENKEAGAPNRTRGEQSNPVEKQIETVLSATTTPFERPGPVGEVFYIKSAIERNDPEHLEPIGTDLLTNDVPGMPFRTVSLSPVIAREEDLAMLLPETDSAAPPDALKQKHWSLGSEFAPLYSYRTLTSDFPEPDFVSNLNKSESGILAYATGIRVAFSAGRRISVQSGMYYSRYGQQKSNIETFDYSNTEVTANETARATYLAISNSTGIIYSNNPENAGFYKTNTYAAGSKDPNTDQMSFSGLNGFSTINPAPAEESDITVEQLFDYLELPLTVKYKIIDRKFDFSLSGGFITNFLVGNTVKLEQNGETTRFGKTDEINQINYLGSVGLGFEYPLVSGFSISIEPRLRYYLNPIDKSTNVNVHPYSFGLFAGISYKF